MSLSEISPIQITFSTAQEISDEILGGAIQFCRESGLIQNITTLTLLWSAFLLSSQEELVENNIIENVKHCYTRSLDNIFPNITTDTETKAQIESMLKNYWENLCVDFTNLRTNVEITNFLYIADKISNDGNADIAYQITEVQQNSFARVASVIRSSIYRILRKIDNGMAIRYSHILDEMRFARICQENTTTQQPQSNTPMITTPQVQSTDTPLGMAWYKFLIYFGLFAGAFLNIIYGINYMTGGIYYLQSNGQASADIVYYHYGEGLHFVDVMFGIFLISFAVFCIVLRNRLAKFKPNTPKLVYIFYAVSSGGNFLYAILVSAITSTTIEASQIIAFIVNIVVLLLNIKYFKKREHLFTENDLTASSSMNTTQTYVTSVHHTKNIVTPIAANPMKISFCRKCGNKLTDDSIYCNKCGTKISTDNTNSN